MMESEEWKRGNVKERKEKIRKRGGKRHRQVEKARREGKYERGLGRKIGGRGR